MPKLNSGFLWLLAGLVSVALTVLAFFPASWVVSIVEKQSAGRLTLGEARGTLWRGSAFIGGASGSSDPVTPLLSGRFSWRLSPSILLGILDIAIENTSALSQPIAVTGSWRQWQVSPAAVLLSADKLAALGTPLNTLLPTGEMRLSWEPLHIASQSGNFKITGAMHLEMNDLASRMSPVKPLGSYDLVFVWRGSQADVTLKTIKGPMQLSGSGIFANGHLKFSGKAESEAGQELRLANLLNLLGQLRKEGDKDITVFEFK